MYRRLAFILVVFLTIPAFSSAATVYSGQTTSVATSTPDNTYIAGGTVNVDNPVGADLSAVGGTVSVSAPVAGDALLAGGTIRTDQPIAGDARIAGGTINIRNTVGGDLFAAGGYINDTGRAKYLYLAGNNVSVLNGANGTTTIYGVDVALAGEFKGNVKVVATDKLTIADGTIIDGTLNYNAPQQVTLPDSAVVKGGVQYIGTAPFVPTAKQAQTFATAGLWIFFIVRILAALVVVGIIVGFYPGVTNELIEQALTRSVERTLLLMLLGFAAVVAVPVLLLLLVVSFVGIGIALVIGVAYLLFLLLSYTFAAALAGSALVWAFRKRTLITWRTALLGVIVLEVVGIIPVIGFIIKFVCAAIAGGALLVLFYKYSFRRDQEELNI